MTGIETERTVLRMFTMDDLDDLARIFGNPQVMKYLGHTCEPIPRDETEKALASIINHWEKNGFGRWAVISKVNNKLIGCAGLRSYEGTAELVYLLDDSYWGKGLATEIAGKIIKYGFETREFPQIIAMTRPGNAASRRVMDKLGMRFYKEDTIFDAFVVFYIISKEDYLQNKSL